jgi:glycerophosphoryl diester phosphodiesterase
MKLLCHRGYWIKKNDQNTLESLKRAISNGYGVETDVRDCDGELVISHDLPLKLDSVKLSEFLELYSCLKVRSTLALNIKSDGLHEKLKSLLDEYGVTNYFVFDMSVPDTLGYLLLNMPFAVRLREFDDAGR